MYWYASCPVSGSAAAATFWIHHCFQPSSYTDQPLHEAESYKEAETRTISYQYDAIHLYLKGVPLWVISEIRTLIKREFLHETTGTDLSNNSQQITRP